MGMGGFGLIRRVQVTLMESFLKITLDKDGYCVCGLYSSGRDA
jgi:hypothetical protein